MKGYNQPRRINGTIVHEPLFECHDCGKKFWGGLMLNTHLTLNHQ